VGIYERAKILAKRRLERMSDMGLGLRNFTFKVMDFFYRCIDERVLSFGIREGMTVVD
jgi:hypothetical protein